MEPPGRVPPKPFGKRGLLGKQGPAPPVITHAPEGLPGAPRTGLRRMRSGWIVLGGFGALAAGLVVMAGALASKDCKNDNPEDYGPSYQNGTCSSAHFHGGNWGGTGSHVSFGGFGGHGGGGGE